MTGFIVALIADVATGWTERTAQGRAALATLSGEDKK
jgi:hypothetical protein